MPRRRRAEVLALVAAWASACDGPESSEPTDFLATAPVRQARLDSTIVALPPPSRTTGPSHHCDGAPLPACDGGFTGPSCTLPCSPASPGSDVPASCTFDLYCHGDGSVYGVAGVGAVLHPGSPESSDDEALAALVAFITTHEEDLGLAPGLEPHDLGLLPVGPAERSGGLGIRRFAQTYRTRPVLPPDGLVQVVYGPAGAIGLTGRIIDGRQDYAHHDAQASASLVADSVRHHAHVRTGVPLAELEADPPTLVAMPEAHALAWMSHARHEGGAVLARVIVDADPSHNASILPLWSWRGVAAESLASTTPIELRTADPATDPASPGWSVESTLVDGGVLLGSIDEVSGDVQLATEAVVVLDLNEGSYFELGGVASRILSGNGEFLDESGPGLGGQQTYHLLRSWSAQIDGYLTDPVTGAKRWDSAVPVYVPGEQSSTPAGTFQPRVLAFTNSAGSDCPPTAVACASAVGYGATHPDAMVFPEIAHQPPGAAPGYEVTGVIHTHPAAEGGGNIVTLAHEFGHVLDLFAGPGMTAHIAPDCGEACTFECIEDTSDEAPALGETIANLAGLLVLDRTFEPVAFEYCDIVALFSRNNTKAFDPGPCMPVDEDISLLQRPGACAKPEPYCDKPDEPGFRLECCDPSLDADCIVQAPGDCDTGFQRQVPTGLCHTSPGYDTHSAMQAFWQLLHGQRCEPTAPFACQTYAWPGGLAPADAIVPAFLHALRLSPLSHDQLFDGMVTHIACTHGAAAYEEVNAVLCAHGIRDCAEPAPLTCATCGNGVREGEETCDGLDWSAVGCADFEGFVDGELSCNAATCQLDLGQCLGANDGGLDSTAGTGPGSDGETEGPGRSPPADTDADGAATGPGDGGSGGCGCRATLPGSPGPWLLVLLGCLAHRRRNRPCPST